VREKLCVAPFSTEQSDDRKGGAKFEYLQSFNITHHMEYVGEKAVLPFNVCNTEYGVTRLTINKDVLYTYGNNEINEWTLDGKHLGRRGLVPAFKFPICNFICTPKSTYYCIFGSSEWYHRDVRNDAPDMMCVPSFIDNITAYGDLVYSVSEGSICILDGCRLSHLFSDIFHNPSNMYVKRCLVSNENYIFMGGITLVRINKNNYEDIKYFISNKDRLDNYFSGRLFATDEHLYALLASDHIVKYDMNGNEICRSQCYPKLVSEININPHVSNIRSTYVYPIFEMICSTNFKLTNPLDVPFRRANVLGFNSDTIYVSTGISNIEAKDMVLFRYLTKWQLDLIRYPREILTAYLALRKGFYATGDDISIEKFIKLPRELILIILQHCRLSEEYCARHIARITFDKI